MAQYYGVQRSDEYLAHYGIRGMKWGVRKALERGDRAALSRHYQRASAKLAKLTAQAKTGKGLGAKRAAIGGLTSGALSGIGTYAINRLQGASRGSSAALAGAAALTGGTAGALLNSGKATKFDKMRAQQKRDEWKRAMDETFKGTKHSVVKSSKTRIKKQRSNSSSFEKGLKKAATRGGIAGALTAGGGTLGSGISTARYIKQHPKEYEAYKKKYKKMSFGQRMRAAYR